jgi:four helix bundle protein
MDFNFEKLSVYQQSLDFANQVITKSNNWPTKYQFSLADQIRRASLSIPLNIAEGSSRSKIEFRRFLSIARGSCYECIPLVEISLEQQLITLKDKQIWYNQLLSLSKMLSSLRTALSK